MSVTRWQARLRPMMGHRSGKARCHNPLRPVFSTDGKRAFYSCEICEYKEQRNYPEPRQLELRDLDS